MKFRTYLSVIMILITSLSFTAALAGQQQQRSSIKPTINRKNSIAPAKIDYAFAVTQNSLLMLEMEWVFSGKSQKGWYIYLPLIKYTIATDKTPESIEFARDLSGWQQANGLPATGILDQETFSKMIVKWQSGLPKKPAVPSPDQLVMASTEYLYDTGRQPELRRVDPAAYAAYQRMIAAALADPTLKLAKSKSGGLATSEKYLKIVSAYRPQEYQDKLNAKSPQAGPGLAKVSHHLTGRALDLYVGGEPTSTKDANRVIQTQTPAYQWLLKNAIKFGFHLYFYEPWHWEYKGEE